MLAGKNIPAPTDPNRPVLAHPIPPTDPSQHQHWNELKSRWEKWVSPKSRERSIQSSSPSAGPTVPTVGSRIEVVSLNQAVTGVKDVTAAWHPASDLKPTHMAGVDAIATPPTQLFTTVHSQSGQTFSPLQKPVQPVHEITGSAGGGASPLQKLREKFRLGGESHESSGSNTPISAAGGGGGGGGGPGSTNSPSSLSRRMVSHNAPTMDIGSPLPSNPHRIAGAENQPLISPSSPPKEATLKATTGGKKSPPPALEPVAVATPPQPAVRRFMDSVKGFFRRASFSAPTPVSDMRSPASAGLKMETDTKPVRTYERAVLLSSTGVLSLTTNFWVDHLQQPNK